MLYLADCKAPLVAENPKSGKLKRGTRAQKYTEKASQPRRIEQPKDPCN